MTEARHHHYISQFYLKGFAKRRSKDAKLRVYDMPGRKTFETLPRNVGGKRDFNRVDAEGVDPNHVEDVLGRFEGSADAAFARIIEQQSIGNEKAFGYVLDFMSLCFLRSPWFRDKRIEFLSQISNIVTDMALSSEERFATSLRQAGIDANDVPESYALLKEAFEKGRIKPKISQTYLIQQEIELIDTLRPLLQRRSWTLFKSADPSAQFATSDRPAILEWNDPQLAAGPYSPGFGVGGTSILFPISKSLAVQGTLEATTAAYTEVNASPALVGTVNGLVFKHAGKQIYCGDDFIITDINLKTERFSKSKFWKAVVTRPAD